MAYEVFGAIAPGVVRGAVEPHEMAGRVYGADRLAHALQNICQKRLSLARHRLGFSQLGKIARRADRAHISAPGLCNRLDRDQQRTIKTLRRNLRGDAAILVEASFNNAVLARTGSQDVAALAA